jgi:hypothetical protein
VLLVVAALLLPLNVWAADLNKFNSLTVEKNSATSSWTATCDISVSGTDNRQTYSGRMLFQFLAAGQGSATVVFDALFQVDPENRTWTQSSPGTYTVTATLKGHDVIVNAEVNFAAINSGDRILCDSRIDSGSQPPSPGATLFGANMASTVATP